MDWKIHCWRMSDPIAMNVKSEQATFALQRAEVVIGPHHIAFERRKVVMRVEWTTENFGRSFPWAISSSHRKKYFTVVFTVLLGPARTNEAPKSPS